MTPPSPPGYVAGQIVEPRIRGCMRFTVTEIRHYYHNLELPEALWKWSRKHYRVETARVVTGSN
ncbi:hypothetical protein MUP00_12310 [Candidatus Bathyarchaeota archaeon]|nr:hypothetical protein [Candidatus Bathyarchaeota archaeon]